MNTFRYRKLVDDVKDLTIATEQSVGIDLRSSQNYIIQPNKFKIVQTGIEIRLPPGTYGRLTSRSSMYIRGFFINAGVIDPDYQGEIKVVVKNWSKYPIELKKHTKIAQMVLELYQKPQIQLVEFFNDPPTERGCGGFGSSGET